MSQRQPSVLAIPRPLRVIFALLKVPAGWLLKVVPQRAQRRWFGSDVFARYTAYYTWIANQLGHFTIGMFVYFLAWCLAFLVAENASGTCPATSGGAVYLWALAFGAAGWIGYAIKEVADVILERPESPRPFQLDVRAAALDGWTDAFFVAFGILFAHGGTWIMSNVTCNRAFQGSLDWLWVAIIAAGLVAAFRFGSDYLPEKRRFDAAELPFYFRLASFYPASPLKGFRWLPGANAGTPVDGEGGIEAAIEMVADAREASLHVCIFGPGGSGKRPLAVGMACNLIVADRPLLYIAAHDLHSRDAVHLDSDAQVSRRDQGLLTLADARWLVVDHVSPSNEAHVIREISKLPSLESDRRVFIVVCDHEPEERDRFVQDLTRSLSEPCLAVHLDAALPRRGSLVDRCIAAEQAVRRVRAASPAAL